MIHTFDTHCHINFDDYAADIDAVIERAHLAGVGMIVVGTKAETSKKAVELAEKYANVWAIVGLHPIYAACSEGKSEVFDYEYYKQLASHPKVVGIGECGFDYFRASHDDKKIQEDAFRAQIALANELGKPLMLHIRSGASDNAYADALTLLRETAQVKGTAHFFAGTLDEARAFIEMGYKLSFTGVITFAHSYDEVIRSVSLDSLMSETDCPYVTPVPYRGERNEPAHVVEVVKSIAELRGEALEVVREQLLKTTLKHYGIVLP